MTPDTVTVPERVLALLLRDAGEALSAGELCAGAQVGDEGLDRSLSLLRQCGWPVVDVAPESYRVPKGANLLDGTTVGGRLTTRWLGKHYRFASRVASTNSEAAVQAEAGAPHGLVVVADAQQAGRGRQGRKWASPPGVNLYLSLVLRPEWALGEVPPVSLGISVAVARALGRFLPGMPTVKWPNDLLWEGRKLSGILVEMVGDGQRVQHLVVGVGLNVNQLDFEPWVARVATSMRRIGGVSLCRAAVLAALLAEIEASVELLLLGETARVLAEWRDLAGWMGGRVSVNVGDRRVEGRAVGLTARGALRVVDAVGEEHAVLAGDVVVKGPW